jgi:mycothiol synthase
MNTPRESTYAGRSGSDITVVAEPEPREAADVGALLDAAAAQDGRTAVSEQGRLRLRAPRAGVRHLLLRDGSGALVGYAQVNAGTADEPPTAEFVVHPAHRRRGHGRALAESVQRHSGGRARVWAHGGHPDARRLADALGWELSRELWQMRRPLGEDAAALGLPPLAEPALPAQVRVRTFVPGRDDQAWLALNAAAFAHHPEQGGWTESDLRERLAEPWFDPTGFFLATRVDDTAQGEAPAQGDSRSSVERLVGFHWTKTHPGGGDHGAEPLGEVYVIAVAPGEQDGGLGRALLLVGLRHLANRGLRTAMLYVDGDNVPAVRLYQRLGFTVHEVDLMFRTVS